VTRDSDINQLTLGTSRFALTEPSSPGVRDSYQHPHPDTGDTRWMGLRPRRGRGIVPLQVADWLLQSVRASMVFGFGKIKVRRGSGFR